MSKYLSNSKSDDTHMNSLRLWQHAQDRHKVKLGQSPELRKASEYKALPLTRKPYAIDTFWEREN
jgi:hypothetical protein